MDENDNAPVFTNGGVYSFDIFEDAGIGTVVGGLEAIDPDAHLNALVTYSVISDWGNDVFAVHPESGLVRLTSRLDFESVSRRIHFIKV